MFLEPQTMGIQSKRKGPSTRPKDCEGVTRVLPLSRLPCQALRPSPVPPRLRVERWPTRVGTTPFLEWGRRLLSMQRAEPTLAPGLTTRWVSGPLAEAGEPRRATHSIPRQPRGQ